MLIFLSFCACYIGGSFVGGVAYRKSLEAALAHAVGCSAAALACLGRPRLSKRLSRLCSCAQLSKEGSTEEP